MTMLIQAAGLAAGAGRGDPAGWFLKVAVLLLAASWVLSLFSRRIGGKGGGSDAASVGAWLLLASIVVGIIVATR
ncbi:MAG: hypothetical protein M3Z25_14590 [Actinomycetota bacterium]|nr:hypothetical protein [Actinomycetota bacterium]